MALEKFALDFLVQIFMLLGDLHQFVILTRLILKWHYEIKDNHRVGGALLLTVAMLLFV